MSLSAVVHRDGSVGRDVKVVFVGLGSTPSPPGLDQHITKPMLLVIFEHLGPRNKFVDVKHT